MTSRRKVPLRRRRFIRARRPLQRQGLRHWGRGVSPKRWFLLGGAVLSLVFVGVALGYQHAQPVLARWMAVHRVLISGLQHVDRREALSLLDLPPQATVFSINSSELQSRLEAHPWIATASVGRVLPHTLTILVTERRPAVVLQHSNGSLLLDEEAGVLSEISRASSPNLPILHGLSPLGLLQGDKGVREQAREGIKLAGLLLQRYGTRPLVYVENSQQIVAEVQGLRFQFESDIEEQWKRFLAMESAIPPRLKVGGHEIDLRFPGKVIFRPKG